jgi:hypothetical protein
LTDTRRLLLEFETDEVGRLARDNPQEMKALVRTFTDSSDIVRERALIAAVDAADPTVVNEISKSMDDDVANVRIAAAQALAFFHQPRTIPVLLKGLKDANPWVKSHCAAGLSKILNGPIWARIPDDALEKMLNDFPDMIDEEVDRLLASIKMRPEAINQFLNWRAKNFDVDIDISALAEELEGTPILISEEKFAKGVKTEVAGMSKEVEAILSELPDELIATLPPEDLKRLTPGSARELVTKLKVSLPPSEKKTKKKTVKVRKVTTVKKKTKEPGRDDLIRKLPKEVRESVSDETLATLSVDELQALLASTAGEKPEEEVEEKPEPEPKPEDPRLEEFVKKYGEEKAALLITIPEVMLEGIPEEQIREMDIETLQGLAQALEPR